MSGGVTSLGFTKGAADPRAGDRAVLSSPEGAAGDEAKPRRRRKEQPWRRSNPAAALPQKTAWHLVLCYYLDVSKGFTVDTSVQTITDQTATEQFPSDELRSWAREEGYNIVKRTNECGRIEWFAVIHATPTYPDPGSFTGIDSFSLGSDPRKAVEILKDGIGGIFACDRWATIDVFVRNFTDGCFESRVPARRNRDKGWMKELKKRVEEEMRNRDNG